MRIFHAAAPELVEEPGRLVILDESPLWSQTEKVFVFIFFSFFLTEFSNCYNYPTYLGELI
jgi:hypothetical protein